ncbi:Helix-turn-helix transcriptional regulator [Sulfidibacter corallicola]|uniref:Helix-turn-helix transcriptional regulator n=1 Tax=Sulfidibacter corallicola TaxID=2818388 RepID=A0A8A4TNJ5_SULCO|nr:helix-turn-helix domain-containing protein [Sulfidibacter corallicola]QTD50672.1 helix-turn-helix transcriptional regulator [Sulfidibacter corallicola]
MPANKRTYAQFCGIARALDVVGERWTLLIVRDLFLGPRRFKDLMTGLPGITTNLLAKRLKDMAASGLIRRTRLPPPAGSMVYELTPRGAELKDVLMALGRWGWPLMDAPGPEDRTDVGWALVALHRRFTGTVGAWTLEIRAEDSLHQVHAKDGDLTVRSGTYWEPDLVLVGTLPSVAALFHRGVPLERLEAQGLRLEGSPELRAKVFQAFGISEGTGIALEE